ncbi:MAG TPA: pyridoxine 5'-phosphate synthase [Vicinamibacterales bacterium]|nr:pyridoxine 5'-phosphate synthase [Vicinamibacterales bacterium]
MIKLSVNVNKVATVRNSRGGHLPSVIEAVRTCIDAGAPGITVHPRADQRHITTADVHDIAAELVPLKGRVEYNIEGDPRPGFLDLVLAVKPDQCTLVPVKPGEITSEAGWPADTPAEMLSGVIGSLQSAGIRVSLFVDPQPAAITWAKQMGADRVELYTEPFARAFERGPDAAQASFKTYVEAATLARELGIGVNAGHDLDLRNLTLFKTLPHLDEVSIGHALISRAIFVGLGRVVKEYIAALAMILLAVCLCAPGAEAAGRPVTLPSADGVTIAGEFYEGATRPSPAVLLVHMLTRNRGEWGTLPDRLRDLGLTVLAIDLRGHGQSSGSAGDLPAMTRDVRAAMQWLIARPNVRPDAMAVVGASLGASLALLASVDVPQVRAIGLLSPSLDYRGLRTDVSLIKRLGSRSLWLAASAEDPMALRTMRDFAAEPSGPREQHVVTAVAHGTALLDRDAEVGRTLVDWLRRTLLS